MFSLFMVVLSKVDVNSLLLMCMHRANMREGKLYGSVWEMLLAITEEKVCVCMCVFGDFNDIRSSYERRS